MELMLQEVRQQRNEQARQHGELLGAIASLAQATQRLEARLAQLQAQGPASAQAQLQAGAQGESQLPPAENLQSRPGAGRWVGQLFGGVKNAAKAILGK